MLYLARQPLPSRGHSEDLNASDKCGNFLEIFKLLAKYNPVANKHLHKVQQAGSYAVSYLSLHSQNEFIRLLGDHTRTEIFQRILKVRVEESFINFIQLHRKSANEITEQISDKLQADGLKALLWIGI